MASSGSAGPAASPRVASDLPVRKGFPGLSNLLGPARAGVPRARRLKIVLLCHFGRTGYNILRSLRSIGAETFIIYDDHSTSLRFSMCCKAVHATKHIGSADPETIIGIVNGLHVAHGIDSVIATDVDSLTLLGTIKDRLLAPVFPMSELETLVALNDKWEFHKLCESVGVAVPKTLFYPDRAAIDVDQVERELGFPVIVKPSDLYGQRGIVILRDRADMLARFLPDHGFDYRGMVIQEYIDGRDWALSVFARHGVIEHWAAWLCPGQLDAEYGIGRFLATEFTDRRDFFEMAEKVVAAANFSGVANFDARQDFASDTIKMLECNPRFFNRLSAARLCGLDFVRAGLPQAQAQQASIGERCYYPWQELFSRRGVRRLFRGDWKLGPLARDLYELATDPLPPVMRKLTREDARALP